MHDSFASESEIDLAALHLGFYLASWGMYRGSTFLLQKDYRVHIPIVTELLEDKYRPLWNLDLKSLTASSREGALLFQLAERIRQIYRKVNPQVNGRAGPAYASDKLITKIMLGTTCCTAAYDQYLTEGLGHLGMVKKFGRNSYQGLVEFYQKHVDEFKEADAEIAGYGMEYPAMKLLDMYFWSIGYELEQESRTKRR